MKSIKSIKNADIVSVVYLFAYLLNAFGILFHYKIFFILSLVFSLVSVYFGISVVRGLENKKGSVMFNLVCSILLALFNVLCFFYL